MGGAVPVVLSRERSASGATSAVSRFSRRRSRCFAKREMWKQILERNREMFDEAYLRFLLDNCRAAYLHEGTECLYVANEDSHDRVFDQVVRTVAMDLASLRTAGLKEGIGHAIVGMFFGRNLIYLIGIEGGPPAGPGTVSGGDKDEEEAPLLLPDMEQWKRIAVDQAWGSESMPIAGLPLARADQFKNRRSSQSVGGL